MYKRLILIMLLGLALSLTARATENVYGPIGKQDTLWQIADQLRPAGNASIQQVIMAIYTKNQHAFTVNNINSIRKNAHMLAPTLAEVNAIDRKTAIQLVQRHNTRWKKGRYVRIDANPPAELQQWLANATVNPAQAPASNPELTVAETKTQAAESTTANSSTVQPVERVTSSVTEVASPEVHSPQQQLALVKQELLKAQLENKRLNQELQTLKSQQQNGTPLDDTIQAQLDALRVELQELRTILSQKDNHIKTLQASLKSASEAIKSQHADNMRLYNKLKELSPNSVPAQQQTAKSAPQLELARVEQHSLSNAQSTSQPPQEIDDSGIARVWADEVSPPADPARNSVPLSKILSTQTDGQTALLQPPTNTDINRATVSPIAWAAVLISFVFILFLIVRTLIMQNEMRRYLMDSDKPAMRG